MVLLLLEGASQVDSRHFESFFELLSTRFGWDGVPLVPPVPRVWSGQFSPVHQECGGVSGGFAVGGIYSELQGVHLFVPVPVSLPYVLGDHGLDGVICPFNGVALGCVYRRGVRCRIRRGVVGTGVT